MSVIHRTTLTPTKLELLTGWLPAQPWYRGRAAPMPAKAGGFRLDDPAGEVGIELMTVTDGADTYLVPMTYRSAPGDGTLIGTVQHGVLGLRYVYDGPTDPVFRSEVVALLRGKVLPQAQSESDTVDRDVRVAIAPGATGVDLARRLTAAAGPDLPGTVSASWRGPDGKPTRSIVLRAR